MATVAQEPTPTLQELADRMAALEEGLRRLGAAVSAQLLPVPASPGHRHLSLVPPA